MAGARAGTRLCECAPALALFLFLVIATCTARRQAIAAAPDAGMAVGSRMFRSMSMLRLRIWMGWSRV
jgi:hypothetical protein